jgi:Tfp pilus assembly protein PilF
VAFDRASKLAPYDVRHLDDMARTQLLLANAGDTSARAKATELSDRAVLIDPNNPQAELTRAVVMQFAGNLSEAVLSVERALVLDRQSTNPQLYVTAVQLLLAAERGPDAVLVGRQGTAAMGRTAQSVPIRIELARALSANGQPLEALAELDTILLIDPNNQAAVQLRATIRAGLGR